MPFHCVSASIKSVDMGSISLSSHTKDFKTLFIVYLFDVCQKKMVSRKSQQVRMLCHWARHLSG